MQEIHHDGTKGEIKTAGSLEQLIPDIRKSLSKPEVKYVKIFMTDRTFVSEEEIDTHKELLKHLKHSQD